MNPCRCGMAGEPGHQCARGARCQSEYISRISGPLMDRIDLRIEVPAVSADDLIRPSVSEPSEPVAARVAGARLIQQERFAALGLPAGITNASCNTSVIEQIAEPDAAGKSLLHEASQQVRLFGARLSPGSARGTLTGRS